MHFEPAYEGKSNSIVGLSSTGACAQAFLTGSVVHLKITSPDGCSSYQYKGLLEISHDDQKIHIIRWTKKNRKTGQWFLSSSWIKM